jgi:hypothetical protein
VRCSVHRASFFAFFVSFRFSLSLCLLAQGAEFLPRSPLRLCLLPIPVSLLYTVTILNWIYQSFARFNSISILQYQLSCFCCLASFNNNFFSCLQWSTLGVESIHPKLFTRFDKQTKNIGNTKILAVPYSTEVPPSHYIWNAFNFREYSRLLNRRLSGVV